MTPRQRIEKRMSERKQRLGALLGSDGDRTDAETAEITELSTKLQADEAEFRAALLLEDDTPEVTATGGDSGNSDDTDRVELRNSCKVGNFLRARLEHRSLTGAEAELAAEIGLEGGHIPMELWTEPATEKRAVTGAPATVGVNLDLIRPAIFAPAILPRLGVEMPTVESGTYASATISTSVTAASRAKSADAPATAAAFTVATAVPKRISARLELTLEDIAAIGQANFESALRENLSMALSDQLDLQGLNGNGTAPNLQGLLGRLTDPTDPTDVADWDAFAGLAADHVDGLWASMESDVAMLVNVDAYRLAAKTFRMPGSVGTPADTYSDTPGDVSAGAYIESRAAAWWTNSRMPATASNIAAGIAHRRGRSGIRTAVCPHWGEVSVDDPYSGSSKAERYVTFHVLLGDVIVVQPGAYSRFDLKVS